VRVSARDQALARMLANARQALKYVKRAGPEWPNDQFAVDAIAARVREVLEVAKYRVLDTDRDAYPLIPWREMIRARDLLTHHYDRLDIDELQKIIDRSLPELIRQLAQLDLPEWEIESR
jgi:uncharacterized protein with HEPN domain